MKRAPSIFRLEAPPTLEPDHLTPYFFWGGGIILSPEVYDIRTFSKGESGRRFNSGLPFQYQGKMCWCGSSHIPHKFVCNGDVVFHSTMCLLTFHPQRRTFLSLVWEEWTFLLVSMVNILITLGLTIQRLVELVSDNKTDSQDFTFAVLLLVNLCKYNSMS